RASRRLVMTASLVLFAACAGMLSLLAASGHITVWHVIVIAMLSGTATALYTPAMHSVVPSLVPPDQLMAAIALNSVPVNLARAAGRARGGSPSPPTGPQACFALDGCPSLAMAIGVARPRTPPRPAEAPQPMVRALREGFGYVRRHPVIGPAIFLAAVMSLFG